MNDETSTRTPPVTADAGTRADRAATDGQPRREGAVRHRR